MKKKITHVMLSLLMVMLLIPGSALAAVNYGASVSSSGNQVTISGTLSDGVALGDRDVTLRLVDSQSRNILADQVKTAADGKYAFGPYTLGNGNYTAYIGGLGNNQSQTFSVASSNVVTVTGVTMNKANTSILVGGSETLVATVAPAGATNKSVAWSSSDTSVATVDQNGQVTGVKAGEATITVTTADQGKTAACAVTVTAAPLAVTGVTLNKASTSIEKSKNQTLVATVAPAGATNKNVAWSSSDTSVATVDQNGQVTGVKAGEATITVTTADQGKTATCTVTVTETVAVSSGQTVTVTNQPTTVTVASGVSNATITVTPNTALPLVEVKAVTALGTVEVSIPAGTKVTGPANWDGKIKLPEIKAQPSTTVTAAQSVSAVIEVGLPDRVITFDQAVRLLVPGQAGKSAGYVRSGAFTAITRSLSADTQSAADSEIPADGDAKVDAGNDLAIWTKHFTEFVAYTPVTAPSGGGGGGGGATAPGQSVTSSGATVSELGASVVIPANAVSSTIKVSISKVSSTAALTLPNNGKLAGDVYEISRDKSGKFEKMVTITLPYDKSKADSSQYDLAMYWWDDAKWVKLDSSKVDASSGKVSAEVDHFTKFAVMAIAKTVVPDKPNTTTIPPESNGHSVSLPDIAGHWAENGIRQLVASGAITGYPDGSFLPNKTITRAEFAVVLVKALGLPAASGKVFADTGSHWAKDYIASAAAAGIVNGYSASKFGPDDPITREQVAVMVAKAKGLAAGGQSLSFKDSGQIASWARAAVAAAVAQQVISGYPDNTFKPKAHATRAEAVSIIIRVK